MSTTAPILAGCLALLYVCGAAGAEGLAGPNAPEEPFFQLRQHEAEYAGPGRDDPPPEQIDEILLGYFGPSDPAHPEGGDMWIAAQLAIQQANREGGYHGKPFRIVPRWSENPWGTGVAQVVRMVYRDKVWAIVGGIDGPSTHLAEQVVAKARLPLVSPVSTDKSANLANVPWLFSLAPGDHLLAPLLAEAIAEGVHQKRFVLVSATDHDSRLLTAELTRCLTARRMLPRYHYQSDPAAQDTAPLVTRLLEAGPDAVVLVADGEHGARLLVAMRDAGFRGAVFGGPAMGKRRFPETAGDAAEGVRFPLLYTPPEPADEFTKAFKNRTGRLSDYAAAHTYDAFRLLVAAVRKGGLNRARIRDALGELSPWSGASGMVKWDPLGSNTRAPTLGTVRDGRVLAAAGCPPRW
jgi:ABC-type branched-subunit amino acid transport system substrate-binding protein